MEKRSVEELHDIYVQQRRLLEKLLQQTAEPTMANPEGPAELSSWLFNPNPHSSPSLLLNNFQQAAHASSMLPPSTSSSNSSNANSSSGLLTTQQVKFGPESHLFEQQFPYLHATNNQTTSLNNLTTSSMTKSLLDASFLPNSSEAASSAPTSSFSYQMQQHVPVHLNDHLFLHALNAFHPVMSMAPQQLQQSQFQLQNTPTTLSLSAGAPGGCSSLFPKSNFSYSSPFATFTPNSNATQNAAAPARVLSFADSTSSPSVSSLPSVTVSSPERKSMGFPSGISIPDISSPELSPTTSSSGAPTPYKCRFPGCEKGFQDTTNTRRHEMTHVNFKPFWCPSCPQRFSRRSSLKSHMLSVHALPKSHPLIIQTLQQQTEKAALTTFGVMNFGEAKPQRRVPRARNRSGSRPVVGGSLSSIKSRSSSGRSTSASSASSVSPERNALRITGVSLGTHKKEF